MKTKFLSLDKKFLYIFGIFNAFVCIVLPIILTFIRFNYENIKVDNLIPRIPRVIQNEVIPHMEPFKKEYFERFFKAAINVRELKYIKLSDENGKLLVEQRKGNVPAEYTQKLHYNLKSPKTGKPLGAVDIVVTRDHIYQEVMAEFWQTFIAMVLWSIFLSLILFNSFRVIVMKPLNKMNEYLHTFKSGQTDRPKPLVLDRFDPIKRRDELDVVGDALFEAANNAITRNIENRDRYKIIEGEVIKRTEEVLEAKQRADKANEEKTEFISHISHEIRNPINAISGFVNILEKEVNDPNEKELIVPLKAATGNLLRLIDDLLDISKAELGKLKIEKKVINTEIVINNMEMIFGPKIKEKGLELIVEVGPDFPAYVITDGLRTAQIMQNLLTNAIKFTDHGTIKATLKSFKLPIQNKVNIVITIEDTGIGVPVSEREKIFEKYRQMTGQSYEKYQGSGLGLAISRKIAKMLNGELKIIDKEGPGTCFELTLKEVEVTSEKKVEPTIEKDYKFMGSKVLVVDDEKLNRDLVMWNLRPYNLKLYFAENGKEALNKALINKPDIILMDLLMPKMDGIESIELIKVYENLKDIPIIVISAIIGPDNEEKLKKLADGLMRKPVLQKDLIGKLAEFLPHETFTDEKEVSEEKIVSLPEDSSIPPKLREQLKEQYLPRIDNLKEEMSIDEIESFTKELRLLAVQYNCRSITTWTGNMLTQTNSFNVDGIEKSFENLRDLVEDKIPDKKAS